MAHVENVQDWTQKEMDELYVKMMERSVSDMEFRKALLEDADKALQSLTDKKLPKGLKLKVVENDPAYTATLVLPDFGTEVDDGQLEKAAGGISLLLGATSCAAAIGIGPCFMDMCGARWKPL